MCQWWTKTPQTCKAAPQTEWSQLEAESTLFHIYWHQPIVHNVGSEILIVLC